MRPDIQKIQTAGEIIKKSKRGKRRRTSADKFQWFNFSKQIKEAKDRRGSNLRMCENIAHLDMHLKS